MQHSAAPQGGIFQHCIFLHRDRLFKGAACNAKLSLLRRFQHHRHLQGAAFPAQVLGSRKGQHPGAFFQLPALAAIDHSPVPQFFIGVGADRFSGIVHLQPVILPHRNIPVCREEILSLLILCKDRPFRIPAEGGLRRY